MAEEVATPMSCGGTEFCMARTRVCMLKPRPRPKIRAKPPTTTIEVSTVIVEYRNMPRVKSTEPAIGKTR